MEIIPIIPKLANILFCFSMNRSVWIENVHNDFHRELLLLSMTVSMGMLIFAGLGYALEKDEPDTMFYTLPQVRMSSEEKVHFFAFGKTFFVSCDLFLGDHGGSCHALHCLGLSCVEKI